MPTRAEQEMTARGHRPGEHLFEYRRAERLNVDFERACVRVSAAPEGCAKAEVVGQTCLVCDGDGVQERGVVILFHLQDDAGTGDIGPLCAACLDDFRREHIIAGVGMVDCTHEPLRGVCRWCGECLADGVTG